MPLIPIDFAGVEAYDNLPLSKYSGSIDKIELRAANDPSKFDQLMVSYLVIDGELTGRKSSEFLSLSPKAAFRLKKWFNMFGLADELTGLDIDDDTNQLVQPDLVGLNVIFEVYEDPKLYQGEKQIRTRLLEVIEEDEAPAPPPVAPKRAALNPAQAVGRKPVVAQAAPADESEAVEDDTEDEDPEPAPTPVRRTLGVARPAAAAAAGPARRSLR